MTLWYTMDALNRTEVQPTSLNCSYQGSQSFPEGASSMSFGNGLYVFGFIGILLVLKTLLTIITMIENKPGDSKDILSQHESQESKRSPLRIPKHIMDKESFLITPLNLPNTCHFLSTLIHSPDSSGGNQRYPLSTFVGGDQESHCPCTFSSPDGSTKSLV